MVSQRKNSDLRVRTFINGFSALLIALFIFIGHFAPLRSIFTAAVAVIGAVTVWEFDQLVKKKGIAPAVFLSICAVVLYIFAIFFETQNALLFLPSAPEIVLWAAFLGCFIHFVLAGKSPITHIATTFLGIVYIAVPLGLIVRVMYFFTLGGKEDLHFEGSWWIIYLIAVTKSVDVGGYFVGNYFGKRKLALKLSPNKTLEGAWGGLVAALFMSVVICFFGKNYGHIFEKFSYWQALGLGMCMGVLGLLGDLAESFLKRDAHTKDSNSIPGVGGILDMIDSLLFTAPAVYIFLRIVYDHYN